MRLQLHVMSMKRRLRTTGSTEARQDLVLHLAGRAALRHYEISGSINQALKWSAMNFNVPVEHISIYVQNFLQGNRAFKMVDPGLTWHITALNHRFDRTEQQLRLLSTDIRKHGGFIRNVLTNVLANSIVGSGGYLLGIAAGYFRASPALVTLALILLLAPALLAAMMFAYGGHKYLRSGGDPGEISAARNTTIYGTVIALAIPALWFPANLGFSYGRHQESDTPATMTSWLLLAVVLSLSARLLLTNRWRWILNLVSLIAGTIAFSLLSGLLVGYLWP